MVDPSTAVSLDRWLDASEVALLDTIHEPFLTNSRFPLFDYVDRRLFELGLDAADLLGGLPSIGNTGMYGLVRPANHRLWHAEETVQLTIAGLSKCTNGRGDVDAFMLILQLLSTAEAESEPEPYQVTQITLQRRQLVDALTNAGMNGERLIGRIRVLLAMEPPDAISAVSGTDDDWTVGVSRRIRRYRRVTTLSEYLERIAEGFSVPSGHEPPGHYSNLGILEAIDFLDVVCQLRWGARLFDLPGATAIEQLSLPCNTADQFTARVSALSDLLARIQVPLRDESTKPTGSLNRLSLYLRNLGEHVDQERVDRAIAILKGIVGVRAGSAHAGARARSLKGFEALGLEWPPSGWGDAWTALQARTVEALSILREEIRRSELAG